MSNFKIEVFGTEIIDSDIESVKNSARFLQKTLNNTSENGNFTVKVFDFDKNMNVSLVEYEKPTAITGRQDSEGVIQVMVKNLVKSGFVVEDAVNSVPDITGESLNFSDNHYTVNYANLFDSLTEFSVNKDTFAVDFKNTLSDILINGAAGGSNFMKQAKAQQKKS